MTRFFPVLLILSLAAGAPGCGRGDTADAQSREGAPKRVATAIVVKDSVRRAVDVVGTLAAVDEVTVSSEADGTVRQILADLGDRVRAGQVLIELDHEKQQYTSTSSRRRWRARSRSTARPTRSTCRRSSRRPTCRRRRPSSCRRSRRSTAPTSCSSAPLVPQQTLDDAATALQSKQASYDSSLQNAKNLRASIAGVRGRR